MMRRLKAKLNLDLESFPRGYSKSTLFIHLFAYDNHIKLKISGKVTNYNFNYQPRSFLHTDAHV